MPVHVLPIRIGFSSPEPVPKWQVEYYQHLAMVFFGSSSEASTVVAERTLPVVAERLVPSQSIARIILDEIKDEEDLQYILLDLGGPDETEVIQLNLIEGALEAAKILVDDAIAVGILLPVAIASEDLATIMLERTGADERIRILSGEGDTWGAYFDRNAVPANISHWADDARTTPTAKLESKLIRRIGQYRLTPEGPLLRHFYDGHLAVDEIYLLLAEWIAQRIEIGGSVTPERGGEAEHESSHDRAAQGQVERVGKQEPKADEQGRSALRVAFDISHSTWFRAPLEAALRHAGLWENACDFEDPEAADADVFVLPIIRTGETLARLLARRSTKASASPAAWALLSTQSDGSNERPVTFDRDGGTRETIFVSFALGVDLSDIPDQTFWEASGLSAIDPGDENLANPFSSDTAWGMIIEAGLVPEKTVPSRRPPVGYVPNFGEIAKRNGPFIAAKVNARLKQQFSASLPPSIGFLCPAELHAEILAASLRSLAGHDTITALRDLIDALADDPNLSHENMRLIDPGTYGALEGWRNLVRRVSAPERPKIVLLDEFDVTGGTFRGLFRLARAFELPVLCTVSLASYHHEDVTPLVPHLTLYEMGRPW